MFTRILNYFKLILFVARVATTGFYAWARPVFVKAVTEVLVRAHEFVGALTSSAEARLGDLVDRLWYGSVPLSDVARLGLSIGRAAGEVLLLRLLQQLIADAWFAWAGDRE